MQGGAGEKKTGIQRRRRHIPAYRIEGDKRIRVIYVIDN